MQITCDLHNGFLLLPQKPCAPFYLIMKKSLKMRKWEECCIDLCLSRVVCASIPKHMLLPRKMQGNTCHEILTDKANSKLDLLELHFLIKWCG